MTNTIQIPEAFKLKWRNFTQNDRVIDENEFASLKATATQTPESGDNEIIEILSDVKTGMEISKICDAQFRLAGADLDVSGITVYVAYRENKKHVFLFGQSAGRNICDVKIQYDFHESSAHSGGDFGYQYINWKNGGDSQGIHIGASYAPFNLSYFSPNVEGQLNILFGDLAVMGGLGVGIHTDFLGSVDFYSKLMLDAQYGSIGESHGGGWSFDTAFGARFSGLYVEGLFPITSFQTAPSYGISAGFMAYVGSFSE